MYFVTAASSKLIQSLNAFFFLMEKLKIFFKNHISVEKLNQHSNSEPDSSGLESNHCTDGLLKVRGDKRKSRNSGPKAFESFAKRGQEV